MMNAKKLYQLLLIILIVLGVGILVSVREANSILVGQSNTLTETKSKSQAIADQQAQLVQDKVDIAKYSSLNTIARSVVPQDKDQAEAVVEIVDLAAKSGIPQLSSITFPPSTLGVTTSKSSGLTQTTAVKGIPGVYQSQITVTQAATSLVPYSSFISFLSKIEQNRRTAQVASISIQPDQANNNMVSFTLVINEFIKP